MNIQQNLMERKRFTNIILIILHIALKFSRKIGSDPPTTQTIKHKGGGGIKRSNILDFAVGEYHTVLSPFGVRRGSGGRESWKRSEVVPYDS